MEPISLSILSLVLGAIVSFLKRQLDEMSPETYKLIFERNDLISRLKALKMM
jgi:hypothetical protein